jgi:hypothetical protein
VEDNEVKAELQEEWEEASVGEKLIWGLLQRAGSSRDAHRFTGHERGLRKARLWQSVKSQVCWAFSCSVSQ